LTLEPQTHEKSGSSVAQSIRRQKPPLRFLRRAVRQRHFRTHPGTPHTLHRDAVEVMSPYFLRVRKAVSFCIASTFAANRALIFNIVSHPPCRPGDSKADPGCYIEITPITLGGSPVLSRCFSGGCSGVGGRGKTLAGRVGLRLRARAITSRSSASLLSSVFVRFKSDTSSV